MRRTLTLAGLLVAGLAGPALAQGGLTDSAAAILTAWQAHAPDRVLAAVDARVQLSLPGLEPAAPVTRTQASALIANYMEGSREEGLTLKAARATAPDQGYAEIERTYRGRGEADNRRETLLLGFRRDSAGWRLAELRIVR